MLNQALTICLMLVHRSRYSFLKSQNLQELDLGVGTHVVAAAVAVARHDTCKNGEQVSDVRREGVGQKKRKDIKCEGADEAASCAVWGRAMLHNTVHRKPATKFTSTINATSVQQQQLLTVGVPALARVEATADAEALALVEVLDALRDLLGAELLDVVGEGVARAELTRERQLEGLQHDDRT
eukprot:2882053-Rhodomonas_salina.3